MSPGLYRSQGYSLVELIIVMLLLGAIAIACENGLHFGAQVWAHGASDAQSESQLVSSQMILRSLLVQILPRTKGDYVSFEGETTTITFDVVPPQAFQAGGTAHAQLHIVHSPPKNQLVLEMQSVTMPTFKKRAVLFSNNATIRFAYLDISGQSQTWLSFWRDRNRLPSAIRITASDGKQWPPLIVRPILVQSATCVLDSVEFVCRKI